MRKLKLPTGTNGDISVNVSDGTGAVSGVSVVLTDNEENTYSGTTDSEGGCTIEEVPFGDYGVVASKEGFENYEGTLTVDGDETLEIVLTETVTVRDVSFTVNDGTEAVSGALVSIGDINSTTGDVGGCTLRGVTDGTHTVTVVKEGFENYSDEITVSEDNTSFTISLTAS